MEIRIMTEQEFLLSKRLWSLCFPEDGAEFIDYYYSERTKPEYALGMFAEGSSEPAAMLHMLPYKMRFGGEYKSACFVAGVCTRPDQRRKGFCKRLFESAFRIMREQGFYACVLQPFDTRFYERFGFKSYAYRHVYSLPHECAKFVGRTDESNMPDPAKLTAIYASFTSRYYGCSLRDEHYFASYIREFSLKDAFISATEHGCCAGYYDGEDIVVFELFFDNAAGKDILTRLLPSAEGEIKFALPCDIDVSYVSHGIPRELIKDCGIEPFCMVFPLIEGFSLGEGEAYCLDRY